MNERIREITNELFSMEEFEYAEEFLNDEFMEKFAELVVRDVVNKFLESGVMSADGTIPQQILKDYGVK